jgi:O-antigen/teichoic acid export membrane protein
LSALKKLAGQTAIYGLSSIVGRLLNYFLVPLYARIFLRAEFGVITELYAYVTFLIIVFTYGMETAYFKFSSTEGQPKTVYGTAMASLVSSSALLFGILFLFSGPISTVMGYPSHPEYISWFGLILALDAISSIPFARLRMENKAKLFGLIKLINIFTNIGFNLFFLVLCPVLKEKGVAGIDLIYHAEIGVDYVFISNLIASAITFVFLLPQLLRTTFQFEFGLWKRMLIYALPLLLAGTAGMVNETIDRILLRHLYPVPSEALVQVGIYGATYKLSILMTLFIQTFRYAAEPFFFSQAKNENSKQIYADVMKFFVLGCAFIFLVIMLYIDVVKHFLGPRYYSGLPVVPVLLLANLCLGIFFNLSIWYKLSGQTKYGAWLAIYGAVVTIALNIWWIPIYGYKGCAWATLICYSSMMVISYGLGQKKFPVNYPIKRILIYLGTALLLYGFSTELKTLNFLNPTALFLVNNLLIALFAGMAWVLEKRKIVVP